MLILGGPHVARDHYRAGHPERPDRVEAAVKGVTDLELGDDLLILDDRPVTLPELQRVHHPDYLQALERFCQEGGGSVDPDTYATSSSWMDALAVAGSGLAVVDELRRRGSGIGLVLGRPPGHHALADRGMGFCLLNNIAIAAAALIADGERVLIVDWDVHHGNGTQEIFWNDPRVLYVSTHQSPLYPGTGAAREVGGPGAFGLTVNLPLPSGSTGEIVRRALDEVAAPVIDAFDPSWVLVSAGFDAHRDDPLAGLELSSGDFAELSRSVANVVPEPGRLALFLEGGYDLSSLRRSVAASLAALLGAAAELEPQSSGGLGAEVVTRVAAERADALEARG